MASAGRIDLVRHLELFVCVAEEGHIGRAADRLDMSQPPLSQALQRLERRLGTSLFARTPHGVELTQAGEELMPRATALLEAARAVVEPVERMPRAIRVGMVPQLPTAAVARVASGLPACGHGSVDVVTAATSDLIEGINRGRLDLAVVTHPAVLAGASASEVFRLHTKMLVPAGQEGGGGSLALRSLQHLALVLPPRVTNPSWHDVAAEVAAAAGVRVAARAAMDDRAAVALVAAGAAMAPTADLAVGGPGVVAVTLDGDPFPLRLRVLWRAGQASLEALAERTGVLVEELG